MRPTFLNFFLGGVLLLSSSCRRYEGSDLTEKEHPDIKEARMMVQQQDLTGAELLLQETLRSNPRLALAHLQLGMIYQSQKKPIQSIYHFQRYLEARPEGEKAQILQQVVEDERRRLAAQVRGGTVVSNAVPDNTASLQAKLAETEQLLAELEVKYQQATMTSGSVSSTPPPEWAQERLELLKTIRELQSGETPTGAPDAPSAEEGRTYTVQRGDTLSRIAQRAYGKASEWTRIYEANRDVIPNKNVVSPGTVLILP